MKNLTRKKFIKLSTLTAAGALFMPRRLLSQECLTTEDILGPYYDPDAPYRTILAHPDEPGTRLFISGKIVGNDCETPLSGLLVEAWQANDNGCYSIFQTCPVGNPEQDEFNLRGKMLTNANGEYAFETVLPGNYGSRPMHIHFMFTDNNGNALVTQLYFEGDPLIDADPWASQAEDRIVPLAETELGLEGEFNLQLDSEAVLPIPGDVNNDGLLNITDVVYIVNIILGNVTATELQLYAADANQDGQVNITDIVNVVNQILGNDASRMAIPDRVQIEYGDGNVSLKTDQPVAGLQIESSGNYSIELTGLPKGWHFHQKDDRIVIFNLEGPQTEIPGLLFKYQGELKLEQVLTAGWNERLVFTEINPIATDINIGHPYPNPFNPNVNIQFNLDQQLYVKSEVFNIRGVLVDKLFSGIKPAGKHKLTWTPGQLPSGLYFVKFTCGQQVFFRQIQYLK